MSFIYKRSKNYWYGNSINGRRIRVSLGVANQRSAQQLKSELDLKYSRAKLNLRHITAISPSDYYQIYRKMILQTRKDLSWHSWTMRTLKVCERFINFAESRAKSLESLDQALVKDYILTRRSNGVSAKTMREELAIIRRFLAEAVQDDYLKEYNIDFRRLQNEYCILDQRHHFPPFTRQEIAILFNSNSPDVPFFKVLYYTGLRRSDVGNLNQRNIDRQRKCIMIITQKKSVPGLIPIHPEINFLFKIKTDDLFPNYLTESLRDACQKRFKRLAVKLGINPECTLHSFRHTFNQRLLEAGLSYPDRQKLLAHSSSKSTQDYTHFDLELTRKYIDRL